MKPAPLDPLARHVLRALYELAELDVSADVALLARAVAQASTARGEAARFDHAARVARALGALEARGLASAERARLTLPGLAQAARLPALGLERELWVEVARQQARAGAAPAHRAALLASPRARLDGASTLPLLRRCADDRNPELKRARRS